MFPSSLTNWRDNANKLHLFLNDLFFNPVLRYWCPCCRRSFPVQSSSLESSPVQSSPAIVDGRVGTVESDDSGPDLENSKKKGGVTDYLYHDNSNGPIRFLKIWSINHILTASFRDRSISNDLVTKFLTIIYNKKRRSI